MRYPCNGEITRGFSASHTALDMAKYVGAGAASLGMPIVAPHSGKVTVAGNLGECGLAVDIDGGRFKSRLCHNDTVTVSVGQSVSEGQQIGTMGHTGLTVPSGPGGTHTHWILWDNGVRVDGSKYVVQSTQDDDMSQQQVDDIYKNIDKTNKRLDDIAKSLDELYKIVDRLQKNLQGINDVLNETNKRLDKIEKG